MMESYYYLLGGKEHGPYSRIAIEKLLMSGAISGACIRSSDTDLWQTAVELGLASEPISTPSSDSRTTNTARFETHRRVASTSVVEPAHKGKSGRARLSASGALLLSIAILGLCVGIWHVFLRETTATTPAQDEVAPQAAASPSNLEISASKHTEAPHTAPVEMTISGGYGIDGHTLVFSPDIESLKKHPELLVNDGALTVENSKLAFDQMSVDLEALEKDCRYEGQATLVVKNSREQVPECDAVCAEGDCGDSCDPYPVASVVSVLKATPPRAIPDYSGACKSGGLPPDASQTSGTNLDQNVLRFASAQEVLDLARRKESADWTVAKMQECDCTINGNVIELDASTRIVLYNDQTGPSVVAYYWEDNHGNPYTHFYHYDGGWTDVGKNVMPGYTGKHDDYFESTPNGVTKWRGEGVPPLKYTYRSGRFYSKG